MAADTLANRTPDINFAIRLMRQARGLTQGQLAARVGTTRQKVNAIERRHMVPTLSNLARYSAALNVPTSTLLRFAQCR